MEEVKTDFYNLLKSAVTDDVALVKVIEQIMKLINKNSIIEKKIDEDLKSELIATTIKEVRKKKVYLRFSKKN